MEADSRVRPPGHRGRGQPAAPRMPAHGAGPVRSRRHRGQGGVTAGHGRRPSYPRCAAGWSNAFVATGHGAEGLLLGPLSGRLVSAMVRGGPPACQRRRKRPPPVSGAGHPSDSWPEVVAHQARSTDMSADPSGRATESGPTRRPTPTPSHPISAPGPPRSTCLRARCPNRRSGNPRLRMSRRQSAAGLHLSGNPDGRQDFLTDRAPK